MRSRLAIITEIIAPYRIPVFNALARNPAIELHVIFLSETDPTLRQWRLYIDEIRFSYVVLPNWRRRIAGYNLLLNRGLRRRLERISPGMVICGGYNYVASWQAARWCKQHGVPLVLWAESTGQDHRNGFAAVEYLKKQFLRNCDACVAAGRAALEYLVSLQFPRSAILTAPDAVDNSFFAHRSQTARGEAALHQRRLNLPPRYFLYVGRLVRRKGVFNVLDAYASLSPKVRSEVGLVFAGDGACKRELERRARGISPGRVQIAGFVQREDLAALYALAEALVFPSHSDPWGLVVNEAMACGLPILTTSVAGCAADLVVDGWNGIVFPPGSIEQMATGMDSLARSAALRTELGAHSTERIVSNSPEACAQGLADVASFVAGRIGDG